MKVLRHVLVANIPTNGFWGFENEEW